MTASGFEPYSFTERLDGRWEQSEHRTLKKVVKCLPALLKIPELTKVRKLKHIASVYIASDIREINCRNLVEPSENHLLNPVILYQRVKCCISEYAAITRGALPPGCEALIKEHMSCETAPFVRNDGTRDTSRDVTTVRGFPIRGVQHSFVGATATDFRDMKNFVKTELQAVSKVLVGKLKGGDQREPQGEIFSNWEFVKVSSLSMDNVGYKHPPPNFSRLPAHRQEELKEAAALHRLPSVMELYKFRRNTINKRYPGPSHDEESMKHQWEYFTSHIWEHVGGFQKMDYFPFWKVVHNSQYMHQHAPLVLIINNIVSTEMSSNAAAEHIGHMSKIITNNEKQRMLPVTALHELMAHYTLPTLVDVVDLNLHKQLAALWYKIGGRNPCGSDLTRKFVRKKKLLSHLTQPVMKNNTSTLYHKGKLRKFNSNSSKISLINTFSDI